jgi:hypothetical protein
VTQIRDATETKASVIAIPGRLFNSLVTAYDSEGVPHPDQKFCDTSRYRLLAHVREIHTEGMAHAGAEDEAIDRRFGIVVSHRTGPARRKTPTMLVSHLLSIERVSAMPFPVDENKRVVLPSLFSWTHMCVPPEMMDIPGSMDHLAEGSAMLRPSLPDSVKTSVSDPTVAEEMLRRLKDGYSLVRWRTQTGEETAAFTRGPLVPAAVKATLENTLSNAGQSLQILDKKLGLMDLSYATAWNLGRTLAMADPAFTAALCRVRKIVLQRGSDKAKIQVMRATGMPFQTKRELVASLQSLTERLADMSTAADLSRENRWRRPGSSVLPVHALDSTLVAAVYQDELDRAAYQVASGYTNRPTTEEDGVMPAPYDELNIPHSADWVVVLQFALNLRFLIPVPFHYLVSDMAALPQESLRFFHIDKNWSHALLDGALSLGNHVDRDCDRVRDAMHKAIQRYHQKPHAELDDVPLVPEYGFLLRSTLVTQFLDLKVTVESPTGAPTSCVLIRQEVVGPGIMLGLLSQVPDSNYRLTFTQPAHQQCFSIGKSLDADQVIIPFKKIYSEEGHDSDVDRGEPLDSFSWRRTKQEPHAAPMHKPGTGAVYLWETEKDADDTRILLLDNLARSVYALLKDKLGFGEEKPTAAMMAIQLNDPCWQLKIDPPLPATIFAPTNLNSLSWAPLDIDLWQPQVQLLPTRPFRATNARRAPPSRYLTAAAPVASIATLQQQAPPHFSRGLLPISALQITKHLRVDPPPPPEHSDLPVFNFRVLPASNPAGTDVVESLPYDQDLVFSIVYKSHAHEWDLAEAVIKVPVGDPTRKCMTRRYRGPGATMLSNLRFNVLASYSSAEKSLVFKIAPRKEKWKVPVQRIKEISFLLSRVRVQAYPGKVAEVDCSAHLTYQGEYFTSKPFKILLAAPKKVGSSALCFSFM